MDLVITIPVLEPAAELIAVVEGLRARTSCPIVVIDDGSGRRYDDVVRAAAAVPGTTLLRHAVNRGKGAALRTAIRHIVSRTPTARGVVTADGDGQHAPDDILAVATVFLAEPETLVLGTRHASGAAAVPLASRLGNGMARWLFAAAFGLTLRDTQTGLRAIPRAWLAELLRLGEARYDFETAMLLRARRHGLRIVEHPIRTIYGGPPSHFRPVVDSARIASVLAREFVGVWRERAGHPTPPSPGCAAPRRDTAPGHLTSAPTRSPAEP